MSKEMREDPAKLSIGFTGIGSSSGGMAVLEGTVAAIEMFDKLRQSLGVPPGQSQTQHPNKPPMTLVSHVLHIAAAPPDGSPHPVWNLNSKFDQLTWATLPDEFKQRHINYSIVTIRPIPRFKEFFLSTNSTDPTTPWFDVPPNYTIMLSGFPPKGLKRQTEPTTATPDPKRPRQDSTTKLASDASPSEPPPNSESATPTANPVTGPNPLTVATMPSTKQQEFMEKYYKLQSDIKQGFAILQKAQTEGCLPEVLNPMKADLGKKVELYGRLSVLIGRKKPPASTGPVLAPSQPPPPGVSIPTSTGSPVTDSNHTNPVPPAPEPTQPPPTATAAEVQNQSGSHSTVPAKESHPAEVATQVPRVVQQTQQSATQQGGSTQSPVANNQSGIPLPGPRRQWHGVFSYAASNGAQETLIYVSVEFQPNSEPRTETWPQKIQISPAQGGAVPPRDFCQWASQNNGILCRVTGQQRPEIHQNNGILLEHLVTSLTEKSMYAVASWPLPNGAGVRRTMIMTAATGSLVGAVFPLTGFSGMPKAVPLPQQPVQQPGFQQPIQHTTQPQLSATSIPPELIPRLQMFRAMQARLGATGRNIGLPFMGNVGNLPGSTLQPGATNTAQQHGQLPSGISIEMMQALMQRKQDG